MKIESRKSHIKPVVFVLSALMLLLALAACSDVPDGTSKTEITSGVSSLNESVFSSDFSENSANSSFDDRTHGEYESSEEVSFEKTTSEDVLPGESTSEESSLEEDVSSEEPSVEVHTCNFVKTSSVSANCTQKGYSVYKCSCGKSENREYVSALGHQEGEWVVITEATVSSTGLKRKTCARCGVKLDEEVIAKLEAPHVCNYVKSSAVAPTCTEQGYSIYKCSCGKSENREYVSALGHQEGEWVVITEATVSSTGLKRKSCTRCGAKLDEEAIAKLEDPEAKYYVFPSMDKEALIEERILYYLNYFRSLDGVSEAGTLLNGKTYLFAQGRAEQISINFAHDSHDERELATELKFGEYVLPVPDAHYDWDTGEISYTGNMTEPYYQPVCGEAITHGYKYKTSIDSLAYSVAKGCYESKDHWSYVGAETTEYITIGSFKANGEWFFALITSDGTYD